ncbi:MAG: ABC transporter ATP-binding protein [Atopobiaceae bacterium]|nr:ABC transporter ATP-binding protein [Atopobiaceae bacterium]
MGGVAAAERPTAGRETVLTVANLEKVYGGGANSATRALAGISFSIDRGEYVAIMGPSGSGKSTLLNCVATIDQPTSGQVFIHGSDVTRMRSRELSQFRRNELGFIFQDANLLDTLTCRENVALPLTIAGKPAREIDQRVDGIARRLGVADQLDKYPYQVSGGQRQRMAACRAMVTSPTLVLADEPTGALDSKNAKLLLESFDTLNAELKATILMVTHDSFAASYCQRVLFIRDGRIFTELRRGEMSRRDFFDRIMEVVAMIGGEGSDVL